MQFRKLSDQRVSPMKDKNSDYEALRGGDGISMSIDEISSGGALRILFVVPSRRGGCVMSFAYDEIESLVATGIESGIFVLETRLSMGRLWSQCRDLRSRVREFRPDLVHVHFGTLVAFLTAMVCAVPFVVTFRGSDLNPSWRDGVVRNLIQKMLSHVTAFRAAEIICVSEQLKSRLWWCAKKVSVIPSGVNIDRFQPTPQSVARKHVGWPLDGRVVIFNAGFSPGLKRLDLAEKSVELLRGRGSSVRLEVLRGKVPHEAMPHYMNAADCLLLTSDFEGSPTVIKEALACGLPIVSVDVGDVRERLEGVTPSQIVGRDPAEIARALESVLSSGVRSNGPSLVAELSDKKIAWKIRSVYERIVFPNTLTGQKTDQIEGFQR
jgi:teichuronic acid biosynthesis glycosyltransferase TuaC